MWISKDVIGYFVLALLSISFSDQTRLDTNKRYAKEQPEMKQPLFDQSAAALEPSFSRDAESHEGLPKILIQKTTHLLAEALNMLENIGDAKARRWLESFIWKVGSLASEMEGAKTSHLLSAHSQQLPFPSILTSKDNRDNKYRITSAQLTKLLPIHDENNLKRQAITNSGIPRHPFLEEDDLIEQLHDRNNIKRSQIPNSNGTLSQENYSTKHRNIPFWAKSSNLLTAINMNQLNVHSGASGKQVNGPRSYMALVQTYDQVSMNKVEEDIENKEDNYGFWKKKEKNSESPVFTTALPHASQPRLPLVNEYPNYGKQDSQPERSMLQKTNIQDPRYKKWFISHIYQQRAPHYTPSATTNQYPIIPVKSFPFLDDIAIPTELRKMINVSPTHQHYNNPSPNEHLDALKSRFDHPEHSSLPNTFLIEPGQSFSHLTNRSQNQFLRQAKVHNVGKTTFPNSFRDEQNQKSSVLGMFSVSKDAKPWHSQHGYPDTSEISNSYIHSKYARNPRRESPRVDKSAIPASAIPIRDQIKPIHPEEITELERQLRAGRVVILSNSLVRTNFQKHPKSNAKTLSKTGATK